jgi:hypothetical protein
VYKSLNGFYINVEKQDPEGAIALLTTGYSAYSSTKMTFYYKKSDNRDTSVNFYSGGHYKKTIITITMVHFLLKQMLQIR